MDLTELVLRDGVVARASGRVLATEGEVWFGPPGFRTLPSTFPRPARPPGRGRHAVRAHGVDVDHLDRPERYADGAVAGWTTLTGTWRRGALHVRAQEPTPGPAARPDRWTTPPCPPPAGGWPTAPVVDPMPAANLPARPPGREEWADLTITAATQFRPHATQPVLVVAAEDPDHAERALRPDFGAALCVVRSRYRQHEIDDTARRLRGEMAARRWPVTSTGHSSAEDGQPTVTARFAWIDPEVAEWAAAVPDGLLDLTVWLAPTR